MKLQRGLCSKVRREIGASLTELSMIIPLLVLIGVGVVEFGIPLSQHETILEATRHVGEAVAAWPVDDSDVSCTDLEREANIRPLLEDYLRRAGFNPDQFNIEAEVLTDVEDGFSVQVLKVTVQRDSSERSCFFCTFEFFGYLNFQVESTFTLMGECA